VLLVVSLGFFMTLLGLTIVNITIPNMITKLYASLDDVLWVINAYALVLAVLVITAGRLGDLIGPVSVTFRTAIGRSACGGRPGRFPRSRSHLGALRRRLAARGCGPADLVAAPRPEGFRPSGRGRPPPRSRRAGPRSRSALTCPHAASRNPLDALAFPRLNSAEAGRPGAPKACL
jgi:hypothetical protein